MVSCLRIVVFQFNFHHSLVLFTLDNCMITGNVLYSAPMEEENSKEIVGECVSAFENENQQNDNNESSSFDESKFDLSSSDLSLSVLNNSRRVLNSTCYNEDESCINILLQSVLGKIDPQNTLREISEKCKYF